jgi:hypothetical protein
MCAGLPPYPQEFQYYGNDKISWVYHVAVWGARCALEHNISLSSCVFAAFLRAVAIQISCAAIRVRYAQMACGEQVGGNAAGGSEAKNAQCFQQI